MTRTRRRLPVAVALAIALSVLTSQAAWAPRAGVTVLISRARDGTLADGPSLRASIADKGAFIAFASQATNLVDGTTEGLNIYVREVERGKNILVSHQADRLCDGTMAAFPRTIPGNGPSTTPSISGDGRFVAFASKATNLTADCVTGNRWHVFLHDRNVDPNHVDEQGNNSYDMPGNTITYLMSKSALGEPGNGDSTEPSVSGSGGTVVFTSAASNIAGPDVNNKTDIHLARRDESPVRISTGSAGAAGDSFEPQISADGGTVVFTSHAKLVQQDDNGVADVFRWTADDGISRVSVARRIGQSQPVENGASSQPAVSFDGRVIAFTSLATNLVQGVMDENQAPDVFVADLRRNVIELASIGSDGRAANGGSRFPRLVADAVSTFVAQDNNAFVPHRHVPYGLATIGAHGVNDGTDEFVFDEAVWHARRWHEEIDAVLDDDGEEVEDQAFDKTLGALEETWHEDNTVAEFRRRYDSAEDLDPSEGNFNYNVSEYGVWVEASRASQSIVVFESDATNLLDPVLESDKDTNGRPDVYLRDVAGQVTERISLTALGDEVDGTSGEPAIDATGRFVAFTSDAAEFEPGDGEASPDERDIFLRDRGVCIGDERENGRVSSRLHDIVEPHAGRAGSVVHNANCDFVIAAEDEL